jgi:hypothetical protein
MGFEAWERGTRSARGAIPRKRLAKGAKKVARKKVRAMKPPSSAGSKTVVVDVVEEPVPGVTVVTEFEATEVRDVSGVPEEPEESRSAPPESEEP